MKVVSHEELKKVIKIAYKTKLSLLVHGTMGIGKSYTIREVAKELAKELKREYVEWNKERDKQKLFENPEKYFVVADFRLSQIDPSDIKGIPMPSNGSVIWKIPKVFEWFTLENSAGIIFFDEINLAPTSVQASCFPKGTKIITYYGIKDISEIKKGDKVITDDGKINKVIDTFKRFYNGDVYKIKATNMIPIIATEEHPFLVCERKYINGKPVFSKLEWKIAKELKEGMMIAIPKLKGFLDIKEVDYTKFCKPRIAKYGKLTLKLDYKMAEFMGLYLAEGWADERACCIGLAFGKHEKELIEYTKKLIKELFTNKIRIVESENCVQLRFNAGFGIANAFKNWFGSNAKSKRIPDFILYHKDKEILRRFLIGYFKGDGTIVRYKNTNLYYVGFSTASETLARQLQLALTRFGIVVGINKYERKEKTIIERDNKRIIVGGTTYLIKSNCNELFELLNLKTPKKKRITKSFWDIGDYLLVRIQKIEKLKYKGYVYNIEVKNRHTYLAENIIAHNCYQIIYDREIGEKPLSDKVIIISAGNRAEDKANIYELPAPLSNRFIHVELKIPSIEEWTEWALKHGIDNRIIAFLNFRQTLLYRFDRNVKDHAFCTPRTWEFTSKLIKDIDSKNLDLIETLTASAVGEATAIEFISFLKLKESVDIDEIIKNPEKIREIDKMDMKYAVISELVGRYEKNKKLLEKMIQIANNLEPIEVRYLFLRMIKEKDEDYFRKNVIKCKGWEIIRDTFSKYLV